MKLDLISAVIVSHFGFEFPTSSIRMFFNGIKYLLLHIVELLQGLFNTIGVIFSQLVLNLDLVILHLLLAPHTYTIHSGTDHKTHSSPYDAILRSARLAHSKELREML